MSGSFCTICFKSGPCDSGMEFGTDAISYRWFCSPACRTEWDIPTSARTLALRAQYALTSVLAAFSVPGSVSAKDMEVALTQLFTTMMCDSRLALGPCATQEDAIMLLNDAFSYDPEAIEALYKHRVSVNGSLADHDTVQVRVDDQQRGAYSISFLGLLNGIFVHQHREAAGAIAAVIDDDDKLTGFTAYVPKPLPTS